MDADSQRLADPGRRPTAAEEAQHLALAPAQASAIAQPAKAVIDGESHDRAVDVPFAALDGPDCIDEVRRVRALDDKPRRPGKQALAERLGVVEHRQHENPSLRDTGEDRLDPDHAVLPAEGATVHRFVVFKTDLTADKLPLAADGATVDEAGAGPSLTLVDEVEDIAVGATPSLSVDLPAARYVLTCNVPAHYTSGMHAEFTTN